MLVWPHWGQEMVRERLQIKFLNLTEPTSQPHTLGWSSRDKPYRKCEDKAGSARYFLIMITNHISMLRWYIPLVCCILAGTADRRENSSGCVQSPNKGSSDHCLTLLYLETSNWVSSSDPSPHHISPPVWNAHSSMSLGDLTSNSDNSDLQINYQRQLNRFRKSLCPGFKKTKTHRFTQTQPI